MPKAVFETRLVTITKEVPDELVLELSLHEAEVLKALCNIIIGMDDTDRGTISKIWSAIEDAEIKAQMEPTKHRLRVDPYKSRLDPNNVGLWVY